MNCSDFEKLIALDLEGDLAERKAGAVAEHVKACGHCQEFREKLKASQALLKSLAQEPVDDAVFEEVRQRIRKGLAIETQRQGIPVWGYALGAAVAAAVILAVIVFRHPSKDRVAKVTPATPNQTATMPAGQAPSLAHRSPVRTVKGRPRLRQRKHVQGSRTMLAALATLPEPSRITTASVGTEQQGLAKTEGSDQSKQLTVKLVTDDPNVVIYWLVD